MNYFHEGFVWLNDPLNWTGRGGVLDLLVQHLTVSAVAVLAGVMAAYPLAKMRFRGREAIFWALLATRSRRRRSRI